MKLNLWQKWTVYLLLIVAILLTVPSVCFGIEKSEAIAQGREAYNINDYKSARDFFEIACKDGSNDGCFYLGYIFDAGKGGHQNKSAANKWYDVAAERGSSLSTRDNPSTQFMYGATFYKRAHAEWKRGLDNSLSMDLAEYWTEKAASQGHAKAKQLRVSINKIRVAEQNVKKAKENVSQIESKAQLAEQNNRMLREEAEKLRKKIEQDKRNLKKAEQLVKESQQRIEKLEKDDMELEKRKRELGREKKELEEKIKELDRKEKKLQNQLKK